MSATSYGARPRWVLVTLLASAALLAALSVESTKAFQGDPDPWCGHGSISYGGANIYYLEGWTTAGTHYHRELHTGGGEPNHNFTHVCGGIGTRPAR